MISMILWAKNFYPPKTDHRFLWDKKFTEEISIMRQPRPLYTRIKRISLYERHVTLKPFFVELEALPNDIANETLLRAIALGAEVALSEARAQVERRRAHGREQPASDLQPILLEVSGTS
ncbi:hypothetical protein PLCT2_00959 [Planctomycetaceae bacterium]|nr:hypothetical protein PLCT2_00959 [Planctomycetaceae bacterium]